MQSIRPESPMSQLWIYFKTTFSPLTGQLDYVSIHKLLCNTETNLQIYKMPHIQHDSDVIMSAMVSQITGVCLLNRLFRCRSKKTWKLRVTGLCEGNSPMTGEFPSQRISNAENASIWWRHHGKNPIVIPDARYEEVMRHLCTFKLWVSMTLGKNKRHVINSAYCYCAHFCWNMTANIFRTTVCKWGGGGGNLPASV